MSHDYNPNSVDAVMSRIEAKLDTALRTQEQHGAAIRKLWAALNRMDVRVAGISAAVACVFMIVKLYFLK